MHYPPASLPGLSSLLHYRPPPASSLAAGIAPTDGFACFRPSDALPTTSHAPRPDASLPTPPRLRHFTDIIHVP